MDSIIKKVKLPNSSTEYGINDVRIGTSAVSSPTHVLGYNSSNADAIGSVAISDLASDSDTKNTAGATDSSAKLFLIGATTQGTNPQTYSQDTAYVGTDGCLYSGGNKVITDVSGKADLVSPAFTGTPTAPTAASGTNNTQIATTAFVASAYSSKTASSGGTDVSLVTTGEKYTWNNKQSSVAKLGSTTQPVYTSAAGTFAECSTYAGGTKVTLNGADKGASTASFYAPTEVGTARQVLTSSGNAAPSWKTGEILQVVTNPSGTTGSTASGSYNRTQWTGTIDGLTTLYDNLVVLYKIPVAGVSRGVTLNINSLGEHPVVFGANATVSTLYPVGSVIPLVYDSTQEASVYVSNTNTEYTGCWKIGDANTTYSAGTLAQLNDGTNTTNRVWQAKIIADYVKKYAVTGPSSSTDAHVATFNGTGGKTIKDSGFTIGKSVPSDAVFTDTTYEFDGTYNSSTNKAATVNTVTTAINNLDGGTIGTGGTGKTITALSQTNGNVSATFSDISITKSQISDFPTIPSKMSDVATISVVAVTADTSSSCSITGSGNAGKSQTIIYTNSSGSDKTVTVPTTYTTPNGAAIELTCPNGGYCEVNYLNISGTIYARGL